MTTSVASPRRSDWSATSASTRRAPVGRTSRLARTDHEARTSARTREASTSTSNLAATAFHAQWREAGVSRHALNFELHEGGHRGTNWRLPLSVAFLAERLAA
jgi:hypothetical protein